MSDDAGWDVLGAPYTAETIELPPDDEGPVRATLVKRPATTPTNRAVLHVHGFADYFFQTGYAEWWTDRGYDFYALDLRKYGRSLLPHQTPTYVDDLADYRVELDAAWARITQRDGHDRVVCSGHSTGGLTMSLWTNARRPAGLAGLVLNSPWLDMQGSAAVRLVGMPLISEVGRRRPRREVKRERTGFYGRSLHAEHDGEWDFDLAWKPVESFTVYAGWLRAIRNAQALVHAGLDVPCPVLVMSSGESSHPAAQGDQLDDQVHGTDIVLDVQQIRRWATALGPHVTYVGVPGARHDVVLSLPEPRARVYGELARWHAAYVG